MNINNVPYIDILGVVPDYNYSQDNYNKENVFINRTGSLHYVVKPISELPSDFTPNFFIGYPNNLEGFGFNDDYNSQEETRRNNALQYFDDKLIIFTPFKQGEKFGIESVRAVVAKPKNFDVRKTYVPVPVYGSKSHSDLTYELFIERLTNEKYLGPVKGIYTGDDNTPGIVLWRENDYTYKVLGQFNGHSYGRNGYRLVSDQLKALDFLEDWFKHVIIYEANPTMAYVEKEFYEELLVRLSDVQEVVSPKSTSSSSSAELTFIKNFIQLTRQRGFVYNTKDLINFHTSMKSSTLTILSGLSGIGKSGLVYLYGQALGIPDENISVIPVRPSWNDDADLIGYVDSIHMIYRPGDCEIINTLVKASQETERENLYLICFDEMNLARVEHYFSQFLSVLEMDPARRYLRLYNDEMENRLYNSAKYPSTIKIGDNVMFVGTVNIDESTHHFSDKVLDRSNVIELHVESFSQLKKVEEEKLSSSFSLDEIEPYDYKNFRKTERAIDMPDQEIDFLTKLNNCLNVSGEGLGFGPRVVKQIFRFLSKLPEGVELERSEALDLQVVQRILTKVKGPEDRLKPVLGEYNAKTNTIDGGVIYTVLEEFSGVADFAHTRAVLSIKAKELKNYGYTL